MENNIWVTASVCEECGGIYPLHAEHCRHYDHYDDLFGWDEYVDEEDREAVDRLTSEGGHEPK